MKTTPSLVTAVSFEIWSALGALAAPPQRSSLINQHLNTVSWHLSNTPAGFSSTGRFSCKYGESYYRFSALAWGFYWWLGAKLQLWRRCAAC
jgi:hypothetical protein